MTCDVPVVRNASCTLLERPRRFAALSPSRMPVRSEACGSGEPNANEPGDGEWDEGRCHVAIVSPFDIEFQMNRIVVPDA